MNAAITGLPLKIIPDCHADPQSSVVSESLAWNMYADQKLCFTQTLLAAYFLQKYFKSCRIHLPYTLHRLNTHLTLTIWEGIYTIRIYKG